MAHLQFTDIQDRPTEFLDVTSLTLEEFQQLVPPFEAAFQAHMTAWRLDGKPRTARRFTVYQTCPLPTLEDRLLFILTYVKTYSLQITYHPQSGWFEDAPLKGGAVRACPLRGHCRMEALSEGTV